MRRYAKEIIRPEPFPRIRQGSSSPISVHGITRKPKEEKETYARMQTICRMDGLKEGTRRVTAASSMLPAIPAPLLISSVRRPMLRDIKADAMAITNRITPRRMRLVHSSISTAPAAFANNKQNLSESRLTKTPDPPFVNYGSTTCLCIWHGFSEQLSLDKNAFQILPSVRKQT